MCVPKTYIRYADDFVFVSGSKDELEVVRQKVEDFLTYYLSLSLHFDKVSVSTIYSGVDFLGWIHFQHHRVLRTVTRRRMLRGVNKKNITSYMGMLGHGDGWKLRNVLVDKIVRRV